MQAAIDNKDKIWGEDFNWKDGYIEYEGSNDWEKDAMKKALEAKDELWDRNLW